MIIIIIVLIIILLFFDCCNSIIICNNNITNHIISLIEQHPESKLIPYSRVYIAINYGYSLYLNNNSEYYQINKEKILINNHYNNNNKFKFVVNICYLPKKFITKYSITNINTKHSNICSISLYSRLIGPEILVGNINIRQIEILKNELNEIKRNDQININPFLCQWEIEFDQLNVEGEYELELLTMWSNELAEPKEIDRHQDKLHRINDVNSKTVNLGGIGMHPYYVTNATVFYYSFEGYLLQGDSHSIYIIINNEKRDFGSWDTFVNLGFDKSDVHRVPQLFLEGYKTGEDLSNSLLTIDNLKATIPKPIRYENIDDIFHIIHEHEQLNYGNSVARKECMIFGSVNYKVVISPLFNETLNIIESNRNMCIGGSNKGRWVFNVNCEKYKEMGDFKGFPIGNECRQSIPAYHEMYHDFLHRSRNMVWKPYDCKLLYFELNVNFPKENNFCENMKLLESINDNHKKLQSSLNINPSSPSLILYKSSFGYCLRSQGIAMIAGFGDSLGDEFSDYLIQVLGETRVWGDGFGLTCPNNKVQIHRLVNSKDISECIESVAMNLPNKMPGGDLDTIVDVKTVVLVTNFMCQHSVWTMTMEEIEENLITQARVHDELAGKLLKTRNITYKRIFYSAIAIHGFRTSGLTPGRNMWFNFKAKQILGNSGWEILDSHLPTIPRPDGTFDGIHYRGGVSSSVVDIFMNMICNPYCK